MEENSSYTQNSWKIIMGEFTELCDLAETQLMIVELHHVGKKNGKTLPNKFRLMIKRNGSTILDLSQTRVEPLDKLARNAIAELKSRGILYDEHEDL